MQGTGGRWWVGAHMWYCALGQSMSDMSGKGSNGGQQHGSVHVGHEQ